MPQPKISSMNEALANISPDRPVLIAGPTASGKSALALEIAARHGGVIVNADASQVYSCWRVITARPGKEDEAQAPHALYGHIPCDQNYSTGHWLREVRPFLKGAERPIIVGGTGLYFKALVGGLAEIPATPQHVRATGDTLSREHMLAQLDHETIARIDTANRARVQRAWEVLETTGRGLAHWQDETPPPDLPLDQEHAFVFKAEKEWLNERISRRFDIMLKSGALDEAHDMAPHFDPRLPAHRAIGAPELVAYVTGKMTSDEAREAVVIATRQFAKRQRTWFRSKMKDWVHIDPSSS